MTEKTAKKVKSTAPIYIFGIVWLICGLIFPIYRITFIIITILLSLAIYWLANRLAREKTIYVDAPSEPVILTGNATADEIILEGRSYLERFRKANAAIEDELISSRIDNLEELCGKIFAEITAHPAKASKIRKFMNYFLPTTLKLLESYDRLNQTGISGDNVTKAKNDIESSLRTVVVAFEKQFDNLFSAEALDISSEVEVLTSVMASDGLIEDKDIWQNQ